MSRLAISERAAVGRQFPDAVRLLKARESFSLLCRRINVEQGFGTWASAVFLFFRLSL